MKWLLIITFMLNCFAQEMREVDIPNDGPRRFIAQINDNCSATFISPTVLLTAEHCIDHIKNSQLPSNEYLIFRSRTDTDVFENVYSITSVKQLSSKRDIALVTVYPPLNTEGKAFPNIQCEKRDVSKLRKDGVQVQVTGYPGSTGSKMREGVCPLTYVNFTQDQDNKLAYQCYTEGGVSGSSLRYENDPMTIFGVHTSGVDNLGINGQLGIGTKFRQDECNEIENFLIDEAVYNLTSNFSTEETLMRSGECSISTTPYEEYVLDLD